MQRARDNLFSPVCTSNGRPSTGKRLKINESTPSQFCRSCILGTYPIRSTANVRRLRQVKGEVAEGTRLKHDCSTKEADKQPTKNRRDWRFQDGCGAHLANHPHPSFYPSGIFFLTHIWVHFLDMILPASDSSEGLS